MVVIARDNIKNMTEYLEHIVKFGEIDVRVEEDLEKIKNFLSVLGHKGEIHKYVHLNFWKIVLL